MDTQSLRLFLRIADLKSVSAAARDLSLSPASASARLVSLEKILGFRLFNRTTRAVALTTDGAEFLPYAQEALETLESGVSSIRGQGAVAQGPLRMTMPGSFGRMHIVPLLGEFQRRHPRVRLDLRMSDEVLDVVEGAYDLIIRNAPLEDSSLVARKLAQDRRLVLASPAYLESHGTPAVPEDLLAHRCVVLSGYTRWKFEAGQSVSVKPSLVVNDGEAMRALIEDGLGIGVLSEWIASRSLLAGRLVEVFPGNPVASETAIWALYPSNRIVAPKVRAMIDFLLEHFFPVPPWQR